MNKLATLLQEVFCLKLFRYYKAIAKCYILLFDYRFTHALVYYGVSVGSLDLGGNRYLNFFLVNVMELPATIAILWAVNRFETISSSVVLYHS